MHIPQYKKPLSSRPTVSATGTSSPSSFQGWEQLVGSWHGVASWGPPISYLSEARASKSMVLGGLQGGEAWMDLLDLTKQAHVWGLHFETFVAVSWHVFFWHFVETSCTSRRLYDFVIISLRSWSVISCHIPVFRDLWIWESNPDFSRK